MACGYEKFKLNGKSAKYCKSNRLVFHLFYTYHFQSNISLTNVLFFHRFINQNWHFAHIITIMKCIVVAPSFVQTKDFEDQPFVKVNRKIELKPFFLLNQFDIKNEKYPISNISMFFINIIIFCLNLLTNDLTNKVNRLQRFSNVYFNNIKYTYNIFGNIFFFGFKFYLILFSFTFTEWSIFFYIPFSM